MSRAINRATSRRLLVLREQCAIVEFEGVTEHSWSHALLEFLEAEQYSAEFRAGISFLAFNCAYPTRIEFELLRSLVALNQPREAWNRLVRNRYPKRSQSSNLITVDGTVVDVTRYSAERAISGIPRIVRNLLLSRAGTRLTPIVWSLGRPGRVDVSPETGEVNFLDSDWTRGSRRVHWAANLTTWLRDLSARRPRIAFALFGVAQWLPVPYVALHPQLRAPRTTVLLHQTTLIVPEVMSRDVADRLTTWQRVGLNVSTRFIVHDMLPLTHSEYFAPGSTHEHLLNLTAFTEAERLFVATPLLAHDLEQFATAMGRSVPELKIVELPIEVHEQSIQPGPRPSDPYVVFMGGFEPRKGLSTFVDYVTAHRDPRDSFRVIIVGTPPMITRRNLFDLLKRIARRSDVFEIRSGLTDDELHALLAGALATIYVSAAEGYGLPVLESLALGTPVITADSELNHHLNELFGGIMPIFDHSTETIDAIRELMNPAHRNVASASIARSRLPRSIDDWADQVTDGLPND